MMPQNQQVERPGGDSMMRTRSHNDVGMGFHLLALAHAQI